LAAAFQRLGAFALAPGSKDAALLVTLARGAYTAHILTDGAGVVALPEIHDASVNPNAEYQRLINISTRGDVATGENVLIGGFIVTGSAPKKSSSARLDRASRPSASRVRPPIHVSGSSTGPRPSLKTTTAVSFPLIPPRRRRPPATRAPSASRTAAKTRR
jgi:hypothetical protein